MKINVWGASLIAVLFSVSVLPVAAQMTFPQPRNFVVDQACSAYTSLKKSSEPLALTPSTPYRALAENKANDATHALLQLPEGQRWVALSCGHYADNVQAPTAAPPGTATDSCLPFFDNTDNPLKLKGNTSADITPVAPTLDAFDLAINQTCGAVGKAVSETEFKTLLQNHQNVLTDLMAFTGGKVFAQRPAHTDPTAYLNDLTEAWFSLKAFDHIFCGELDGGKIGGLHFHGRYLQLQESGAACRMDNYRQNEVVPGVIYTMGVTLKTADGNLARHATKGYGLTLSASDMLKVVTRAFAENPSSGKDSTACLLPITDDAKSFTTVFVRRAAGIRTFYPDATPAHDDPACQAAISGF